MRTLRAADGALLTYCVSAPSSPHGVLLLLHGVASNHTRWVRRRFEGAGEPA